MTLTRTFCDLCGEPLPEVQISAIKVNYFDLSQNYYVCKDCGKEIAEHLMGRHSAAKESVTRFAQGFDEMYHKEKRAGD